MKAVHLLICGWLIGMGMAVGGGRLVAAQDRVPSHSVGVVPTSTLADDVKERAWAATRDKRGKGHAGAMGKADLELALLYYHHRQVGPEGMKGLRTAGPTTASSADLRDRARSLHPVSTDGERVRIEAIAATEGDRMLRALRRLGLVGGAATGRLVSGELPIGALRAAAQLPSVRSLRASHARLRAGRVGSEADTAHGSVQVRAERGVAGAGQKVCALSDSYDRDATASTTASDDVASGDLPGTANPEGNTTPVDVRDDRFQATDEGRAMLQLIHDMAPEAELGFHTAAGGLAAFADGIRTLATDAACTVLVDDIGYSTEPFYQDGPVSNAVDEVVDNNDVVYVAAAGNDGQNSYAAPFRNSGEAGVLDNGSERHNFDPTGTDTAQRITVQDGGTFRIFTFQWTDPSAVVEGSVGADTDLDVALVNRSGTVVAQSARNNSLPGGSGVPVEGPIEYTNETGVTVTLELIIEKADGPDPDSVKYIYSGQGFTIDDDYGEARSPTVYGHPMAEGALAVAAAPFFNTGAYNSSVATAVLESFSSKGGLPVLFDQNGIEKASPEQREKPDVTGADGIDNTFFGEDLPTDLSDPDPHPNFFGTSAAAPGVAAIAALVRQVRPELAPAAVYDQLESTAQDVTERQTRSGGVESVAAGVDPWSGHGFVDAEAAVPLRDVFDLQIASTSPDGETLELSWGVREGTTIQSYDIDVRYFDEAFEDFAAPSASPVSFSNPGLGVYTYRVRWTRMDGKVGERRLRDTLGVRQLTVEGGAPDAEGRRPVTVSWTGQPGPRTANFDYRLERKRGTTGSFERVGPTLSGERPSETKRVSFSRQPPGTYRYRVRAQDEAGNAFSSAAKRFEVRFDGTAVTIGPYPNPAERRATIDLTAQTSQTVDVEVYDTMGRRVYSAERAVGARAATPLVFPTNRWSSGLYLVRLRGDTFTKTRKLVVRR